MIENTHEIRFCRINEYHLLQKFINDHWKKNHILAADKKLLDWQHLDKKNKRYNFIVAYNQKEKNFDAILGFIPTHQYDAELINEKDIWLAIWKVIDNKPNTPGLGLALLQYLTDKITPRSIISIGINNKVNLLYQKLGYKTGELTHYYLRNPDILNHKIMLLNERSTVNNTLLCHHYEIKNIKNLNSLDDDFFSYYPKKSKNYFIARYVNHPTYDYHFLGLFDNKALKACFVVRPIFVNQSCCLRIVDFCGDILQINNLTENFLKILKDYNAEYIDILNYGIQKDTLIKLGFKVVDDTVTIPSYFEPFEKTTINIMFAAKCSKEPFYIFKGDSDQDRPNELLGNKE